MNKNELIQESCQQLKEGKILLCPSDTLWGLSCDATDEKAVNKLIELKNRPQDKSFIILVNSDYMINNCIKELPEVVWDILDYADKPISIISEATTYLAKNAVNQDGTVAFRMVKTGIVSDILNKYRKPIISTSANVSGDETPLFFKDINPEIIKRVDFQIPEEFGEKLGGNASKIIKINTDGEVKIIRK